LKYAGHDVNFWFWRVGEETELESFEIPFIDLDRVFHIGTMDSGRLGKGAGGASLEGDCLSVSLCPHAWRYIARLGGNDLFELTNQGGRFVDIHALIEDGRVPQIVEWAKGLGLAKDANLWKSWNFDDEADEWRYFVCATEEEAIEEGAEDGIGPDGGPAVCEVTVPVGTWKLAQITGMMIRDDEDATDAILLAFSMTVAHADGAWWRERFDPESLSAPRGGIFKSRVSGWTAKKIAWKDVDDEEELDAFEAGLSSRPRL